ncbi:MAG: hypothetical protein ABFD96_04325 [Armatimonadia bacterium]
MCRPRGAAGDPLSMRQLDLDGTWVLPPALCSDNRRAFFERAKDILGFYASMATFSKKGGDALRAAAGSKGLADDTPFRLRLGGWVMRSTYGGVWRQFEKTQPELTNQVFLMVYGNFEAYLLDMVHDALSVGHTEDPTQEAIQVLACSRWPGKFDRIHQQLGVGLGKGKMRNAFANLEMGFLGQPSNDPVDFLQKIAGLRHCLVHSAARADSDFVASYPRCGLSPGDRIQLPFEFPFGLHMFFVLFTDVIDEAFCLRFGWARREVLPEQP